jgi:amidohydrolase
MDQRIIDTVTALRAELHALAERSGAEKKTKARLMEFLRANTSLSLVDEGQWFCAIHKESGVCSPVACETIAFRADMDALPVPSVATDGTRDGAAHLCGHDGHSAALAGLGLWLAGRKLGRNVVLVFQHAEETGEGGRICAGALEKYGVARVYAFHNIPGWEEGAVLLRRGVFACASRGMTLTLTGAPSHAAYPEYGRNPGYAAARLISALPELTRQDRYKGLTMATLIGADIGGKAFGSAAAHAEVRLTLRAWREDDMAALTAAIEETARAEAARDGVKVAVSFRDIFPATVNDDGIIDRLEGVCRRAGLGTIDIPEPLRWSEDFGWYGQYAKTVLAGIGAGMEWPQLHTEKYEFNDRILPAALTFFSSLAESG